MIAKDVACIVLASGNSKRFGVEDKLAANLNGLTVLETVLATVRQVEFGQIFVVSQQAQEDDLHWVINTNSDEGQGHALRLGVKAARASVWDDVVIVLGDMPLVTQANIISLLHENSQKQSCVSLCQGKRMPPAYFNALAIDLIFKTNSKLGARAIFDQLNPATVSIDVEEALDVDTPEDLARVVEIINIRQSGGP